MRHWIRNAAVILISLPPSAFSNNLKTIEDFEIDVVINNLDNPKSLLVLNDNELLIGTKEGKLLHFNQYELTSWDKPIEHIQSNGQGGILDLKKHPEFNQNGWIYFSYSAATEQGNRTSLGRFKINNNQLAETQTLFQANDPLDTSVHFGAEIAFLPDNTLLLTVGEGFDHREDAQRPLSHRGKVLRMTDTGSVPEDNPFINQPQYDPYIWTIGHRNPQGIIWHTQTQQVIEHEHGPDGGDELNYLTAGENYGWPVITQGKDYLGSNITPFKIYPGMHLPKLDWTPSIAPSSMVEYQGDMFAEMSGDLLITTLKTKELHWVQFRGLTLTAESSLFRFLGARFRDVKITADGAILILTDGQNAQLLRVSREGTNTVEKKKPKLGGVKPEKIGPDY